jgi:hypothetical protein
VRSQGRREVELNRVLKRHAHPKFACEIQSGGHTQGAEGI